MSSSLVVLLLAFLTSNISASPLPITDIGYQGTFTTGAAPFLAATDVYQPVTGDPPSTTFSLPDCIETNVMAPDTSNNNEPVNIFNYLGTFTPYHESKTQWCDSSKQLFEYGLPEQCKIRQAHLLSRHGSRFDTHNTTLESFFQKNPKGSFKATDELEFLNNWEMSTGVNELSAYGNKELFDKGAKLFYRYGQLAKNQTGKVLARATTTERVTASAEYFLSGFFGLDWQSYANLELSIDAKGFNSTIAPSNICTNEKLPAAHDNNKNFRKRYLKDARKRLNSMIENAQLSIDEVLGMQKLCGVETVTLGSSDFCSLFTLEEWENFNTYYGYRNYNLNAYGNPKSKASGLGWLNDLYARINGEYLGISTTNNSTLENPQQLKQNVYFDFTHASVILNVITALDVPVFKTQFSIDNKNMITNPNPVYQISDILPFAAQLVFEIIDCDGNGVPADRSSESDNSGSSKSYVHALLNDRTLPLDWIANESRDDGWIELDSFLPYVANLNKVVNFDQDCFGNFTSIVTDGVPQ